MHILKERADRSQWEGKDGVIILYIYIYKGRGRQEPVGGEDDIIALYIYISS